MKVNNFSDFWCFNGDRRTRGPTERTRSRSIFIPESWFLAQIEAKSKGYPMRAPIYQNSLLSGVLFIPKRPQTVQNSVPFLGGRYDSDGLLPDPLFLPQ